MLDLQSEYSVLMVEWDKPHLPPLIGPFLTPDEAREFADMNCGGARWQVSRLSYPYRISSGETVLVEDRRRVDG